MVIPEVVEGFALLEGQIGLGEFCPLQGCTYSKSECVRCFLVLSASHGLRSRDNLYIRNVSGSHSK